MFQSFLVGSLGGVVRFVGVLVLALSGFAFIMRGPAAPLYLILGVAMIVGGSYMKYLAAQTVRVKEK